MQADRPGDIGGFAFGADEPEPLPGFRYALDAAASKSRRRACLRRRELPARDGEGMADLDRHVRRADHDPVWRHARSALAPQQQHWNYVFAGRTEVSSYGALGHGPAEAFVPGDVAYFPRGFGHAIRSFGNEPLVAVQVWAAAASRRSRWQA